MYFIKKIELTLVLVVAIFAIVMIVPGMYLSFQAHGYVEDLEAKGVQCARHKEDSGPSHTRMIYWICDNGEKVHSRGFKIERHNHDE